MYNISILYICFLCFASFFFDFVALCSLLCIIYFGRLSCKRYKKDGTYEYVTIIQTPKSKNSVRTVPIPSSLATNIKRYIAQQKEKYLKNGIQYDEHCLIFTSEACKCVDAKNLRRAWERALKRVGIEKKTFHSIRHTYATKLFEAGIPLKTVQSLLGHSSIEITANIYTHVMPKEKTNAAESLNRLFK